MARQSSNKILYWVFSAAFSAVGFAGDYECKDWEIEGQLVKKSETLALCTMKDPSYFISRNCTSLDCDFITRLKKINIVSSIYERPGSTTCVQLGGIEEEIKIKGIDGEQIRCVFPEDRSTISLNLLESWDGKYFKGPGRTLEF